MADKFKIEKKLTKSIFIDDVEFTLVIEYNNTKDPTYFARLSSEDNFFSKHRFTTKIELVPNILTALKEEAKEYVDYLNSPDSDVNKLIKYFDEF